MLRGLACVSAPAALLITGCVAQRAQIDPARLATERAVQFLAREVPAWSRENHCFSCHNNGDGARALYAAAQRGYPIAHGSLAETTAWLLKPTRWEENPGDPGFSDKRLANLQFAAALQAGLEAGTVKEPRALSEAARKVTRDQSADGSWQFEPGNPLGSPVTYGTSLATAMALRVLKKADATGSAETIRTAEQWLQKQPVDNVPAAAALLLTLSMQGHEPVVARALDLLRRGQSRDGGWGPYPDSPPEPFDTAVALLALVEFRNAPGWKDSIERGRGFLARTQNADGSWPATTRPPGGDSYAQGISTTSWATLALLASAASGK
jgi:hypothetical protein